MLFSDYLGHFQQFSRSKYFQDQPDLLIRFKFHCPSSLSSFIRDKAIFLQGENKDITEVNIVNFISKETMACRIVLSEIPWGDLEILSRTRCLHFQTFILILGRH